MNNELAPANPSPGLVYDAIAAIRESLAEQNRTLENFIAAGAQRLEELERRIIELEQRPALPPEPEPSEPEPENPSAQPEPTEAEALEMLRTYVRQAWELTFDPTPASALTRRYNRRFARVLPFPVAFRRLVDANELAYLLTPKHARLIFPSEVLASMSLETKYRYSNPHASETAVKAYLAKHATHSREEAVFNEYRERMLASAATESESAIPSNEGEPSHD